MSRARRRDGFTIIEILVALVLIALIVAVLIPSVTGQLGKGEVNRVVEDLEGLRTAVKMFRTDVQRWPRRLEQLAETPANWADSTDLFGNAISVGLINKWDGPYLDIGSAGDSLTTALGGEIYSPFTTSTWGGTTFLTIVVRNITKPDAKNISLVVDGDTIVELSTADSAGRVRFIDGAVDSLRYLAAPTN